MQFPTANTQNVSQYVGLGRSGQSQQHNPWQSGVQTQSYTQSWPNEYTYPPSRDSTPSPHFPEAFPFAPAPQSQFPTTSSSYTPEQAQFNYNGSRGTRIDGGVFVNVGGNVQDRYVDTSVRISGQGHNVNISPDYHQELNGHYMNGLPVWPR